MRKFTKKRAVVALSAVVALAFAAVAFAYLNSTGSGSGTGAVSTSASALSLSGATPDFTQIGGPSQVMTITASNTGANPEHVTSISADPATVAAGCPADSFTLGTFHYTGAEVPAGTAANPGTAVVASVPVTFNDVNADQTACLSGYSFSLTSN